MIFLAVSSIIHTRKEHTLISEFFQRRWAIYTKDKVSISTGRLSAFAHPWSSFSRWLTAVSSLSRVVLIPNSAGLKYLTETGGLFRMLAKLMIAKSSSKSRPEFTTLMTLLGRYFQIRDEHMNLTSPDVGDNLGKNHCCNKNYYKSSLIAT